MATQRYLVDVRKFTGAYSSEVVSDREFTSKKVAQTAFLESSGKYVNDPDMYVAFNRYIEGGLPQALACKYRNSKQVALLPAFFATP